MTATVPEPAASRREMEQLRTELQRIDDHGTRAVNVLHAQLADLVKDVSELQSTVTTRFEGHQRLHDQERTERVSSRRWLTGTALAGLGTMGGVVALLLDILHHLH